VTAIAVQRLAPPLLSSLAVKVDAIHRYWLREFGAYPDPEDSMLIVSVIAALDELAAGVR
jgi:hypothetical protein